MEVQYIHFETVDSTNSWVKAHALEFDPKKLTCIRSDIQTAGYGRHGRKWVSKKGNLHLSLFFVVPTHHSILSNIAQLVAFSLSQVLLEKGISVLIKWPNDLLFAEKKLSGVLVETVPLRESAGVVVGLGVNVYSTPKTDQPTTSLQEISKTSWDLQELTELICSRFSENLHLLIAHGFSFFKEAFENLLAFKGEKISCRIGEKNVEGILDSLTEKGHLNIKLIDGTFFVASTGDIQTLRKL